MIVRSGSHSDLGEISSNGISLRLHFGENSLEVRSLKVTAAADMEL